MPIYEYACKKCGQTIEVIQRFSDPLLKKHAGCGGGLTKLISASGFQFKGTGWYVTDYGKGKSGSSDSAGSSSESKSEGKSEGKTESAAKESSSGSSESSAKPATSKTSKPSAKS